MTKIEAIRAWVEGVLANNHVDLNDFDWHMDAVSCGNADDTFEYGTQYEEKRIALHLLGILNGDLDEDES